jgi:hypothetical protein
MLMRGEGCQTCPLVAGCYNALFQVGYALVSTSCEPVALHPRTVLCGALVYARKAGSHRAFGHGWKMTRTFSTEGRGPKAAGQL